MKFLNCLASMLLPVCLGLGALGFSADSEAFWTKLFGGGSVAEEQSAVDAKLNDFLANKRDELKPFYKALFIEGERNAVLNLNQLGLASMELGNYGTAEKAFDFSINRIDAIYADDENARKAKSIYSEESVKDWKGEPYERALTYYYRGLLYLKSGEFDNARASFKAAEFQDTQSEKEEFQSDFALMNYMAGWSSACYGDKVGANEFFEKAAAADASYASLPRDSKAVLVIDSGRAPIKKGEGEYKEVLTFEDSNDLDQQVSVAIGKPTRTLPAVEGANLIFQATTRGGRPIQGILDGKAQFKESAEQVGDVATTAGMVAMTSGLASGNNNMAGAGGIFMLVGLVAQAASAAATPAADTRYWGSAPRAIYLASAPKFTTNTKIDVKYETGDVNKVSPFVFVAQNKDCTIGWGRTRSALATANVNPSPVLDDSGREDKNKLFRDMMLQAFKD